MRLGIRKRIFLYFVLVIMLFGVLCGVLGAWLINGNVLAEAQRRVSLDLRSAWSVLQHEQENLRLFVSILATGKRVEDAYNKPSSGAFRADLEEARLQSGFDFFSMTDSKGRVILRTVAPYHTGDYLSNDPFVSRALRGETISGFSVLSARRLQAEGGNLEERAFIVFKSTPKAKPRAKDSESAGMCLVAAAPIRDDQGNIQGALYAGILLNRNYELVDRIRSMVFEDKQYKGRHLGTVTIFQWDTRIATNVTTRAGNRAIGTRVSAEVYDQVLENDRSFYDRAFVVNDWYISAYDPIHNLAGKTIGILYVGVLAQKYEDLKMSLWKLYGVMCLVLSLFVLGVGGIFSARMTGSVRRLADAAAKIEAGDFRMQVPEPSQNDEVRDLTRSFNAMAASLQERDEKIQAANKALARTNDSLQRLNASYLDMLGFVSHELKNTLGVIYTSARALEQGFAGKLTSSQETLIKNISRSIHTAVVMTRNYLDLSRIEKGELKVDAREIELIKDVIAPLLEELRPAIEQKRMQVENRLPESLDLVADPELIRIVFKNLLDNAVQYGRQEGRIRIGYNLAENLREFEVYNEGKGLRPEEIEKLFGKFVRFDRESQSSRSTGLGLFITREIIRRHGGSIRAESEPGCWIRFVFT
ncbi:MAG: cache domain-containing protein, partial [Desulfobacteraceae bacterium]|nr:cache domain-containing protein [Desulfobacteraceae bacterium]